MDGTLEPNRLRLTRALGAGLVAPTISASVPSVQDIDHAAVFSFSKLWSLEFFDARRFSNEIRFFALLLGWLDQNSHKPLIMLLFSHFL